MITVTKKIRLNGTSLTVNITKELKEMGLDRGDAVVVTLQMPEGHDAEN